MKGSWYDETPNGEGQQACSGLRDGDIEMLLDTVRLQCESIYRVQSFLESISPTPPRAKAIPITNNRFESILPIKDVCTMIISGGFATNAIIETISSTALL